jgi:hypothetical protein
MCRISKQTTGKNMRQMKEKQTTETSEDIKKKERQLKMCTAH